MKGWLARAAASAARRGRLVGPMGGARWFPRFSAVETSRFQGPDEACPGHWRRAPRAWSAEGTAPARVAAAFRTLPDLWQAVLWTHDGQHRSARQTADELGLTTEQARQVLSLARATLRAQLAEARARS